MTQRADETRVEGQVQTRKQNSTEIVFASSSKVLLIRKTHWEAIGLSSFKRTLGGGENGVDISF